MQDQSAIARFPRVPMGRRTAAFAVDFGIIWLLCSPAGGSGGVSLAQVLIFMVLWLVTRVYVVYQNQGQSLGRWAFDMKIVNLRFGRVPSLIELWKRESLTGLGALLMLIALGNLSPTNAGVLLLTVPLLIDCAAAWLDPLQRQAFHDRIVQTSIVATRRGFSLDIKLRKMIAEMNNFVKK
jgi:uncharacterized RDD family membrane protein YckC